MFSIFQQEFNVVESKGLAQTRCKFVSRMFADSRMDRVNEISPILLTCFGKGARDLINGIAKHDLIVLSLSDDGLEKVDERCVDMQYESIYAFCDLTSCCSPTQKLLERGIALMNERLSYRMTSKLLPASRAAWQYTAYCNVLPRIGLPEFLRLLHRHRIPTNPHDSS